MNDKTSQRTEEEMLDQTFAGYDQEMTATTEDPQTAPAGIEPAKKSNSTAIALGAAGVAAIGIVGYMFLGNKPPATPAPIPVQTQTQAENTNVNPPVAPVVENTPVAPVVPAQPTATSSDAATNFLSNQSPDTNPLAGNKQIEPNVVAPTVDITNHPNGSTTVTTDAPVSVVTSAPANDPVVPPATTVNIAPVSNATPATANNLVQQELVQQLKLMFEQQTREIKSSVDQVGNRVTELEKTVSSQKDINKSIEERLAALEAGKPTRVVTKTADNSGEVRVASVKPKVKKVYHKPRVIKNTEPRDSDLNSGSNLLVDKSSQKALPSFEDIQIHSVFAGRVWTKNKDGSLSTYSAGDRLSTGEIIKRIDDEKSQIITNERVIR